MATFFPFVFSVRLISDAIQTTPAAAAECETGEQEGRRQALTDGEVRIFI